MIMEKENKIDLKNCVTDEDYRSAVMELMKTCEEKEKLADFYADTILVLSETEPVSSNKEVMYAVIVMAAEARKHKFLEILVCVEEAFDIIRTVPGIAPELLQMTIDYKERSRSRYENEKAYLEKLFSNGKAIS